MNAMFKKWGSKFEALGKAAAQPAAAGRQPDWTCTVCGCDGNWDSRAQCRRCQQPRAAPPAASTARSSAPRAEELTDLQAVEDELKAHRASLVGFQPFGGAPWVRAAVGPIHARIEELRARQLALKSP
eukprot:1498803-Lingulodinium_polyedra.AAC.1